MRKDCMSKKKDLPFNLGDSAYQFWRPLKTDEETYNFHHLDAFKHSYRRDQNVEVYDFYITFSHHVFTVKPEDCSWNHKYEYNAKPSDSRYFCSERHELSLQLPEIVKTLPERYLYHGGYGKYCHCPMKDENGQEFLYQVVFRVFRSQKKLRLHVESAYKLSSRPKTKKVSFWVICHNLLNKKPLPKPSR